MDVNALKEAIRAPDFVALFVAAKAAHGYSVEAEISASGEKVPPEPFRTLTRLTTRLTRSGSHLKSQAQGRAPGRAV